MITKNTNKQNSSFESNESNKVNIVNSPRVNKTITLPANAIYFVAAVMAGLMFSNGYFFAQVNTNKVSGNALGAVDTAAQPQAQAQQAPPEPQQDLSKIPNIDSKEFIRGGKDAKVVLVEYSDFECPFCKRFHPTMQQVMKDYGDKVGWVYRHYPLGFHPKAQKTAEAAECAGEIGGSDAYWKMTDAIFEAMPSMELAQLPEMAKKIGVDQNKFQSCLDSGKYKDKITEQMNAANAAGISGTPGTVIISKDGKRDFVGGAYPLEEVKKKIDALL